MSNNKKTDNVCNKECNKCDKVLRSMFEEIKELRKSMDFFNYQFETMMKELTETKKELVTTKKENEQLNLKVIKMNGRIDNLESQMQMMNNQQLQSNLEVSGLPCAKDENCNLVAFNVIRKVLPTLKQEDIKQAHRIGNPKNKNGETKIYRPLLIKFNNIKTRNDVYKNKKLLMNIDTIEMGLSKKKEKLFINENLCNETKAILGEANALRKSHGWKYLWTNNGVILLRKSGESKVLAVRSKNDLLAIN